MSYHGSSALVTSELDMKNGAYMPQLRQANTVTNPIQVISPEGDHSHTVQGSTASTHIGGKGLMNYTGGK